MTLTATPIPRTLNLALSGIRDLSTIETPPEDRHPVATRVTEASLELVRDALLRELERGGQSYYVHNRVESIEAAAEQIRRLVPDARVVVGHGQMEERALERVMGEFVRGEAQILVCTTIIESGLDIPNANTIILDRADRFGLADLYQLRGRVGRALHRAYALLLVPRERRKGEAGERVEALQMHGGLGAGYRIAMRDLEIRGAGNLLGGEQSGFINDIGFETYQKILNEALEELKQEHFQDLYEAELKKSNHFVKDTLLETDFEILIPDEYVGSITERISLYKELDDLEKEEQMQDFIKNMVDRFGPIPEPAMRLIETMRLRWVAAQIGIEKLVLKSEKMIGYFITKKDSPYYQSDSFTRVLDFIKTNPTAGKMYEKDDTLRMSFNDVKTMKRAVEILTAMAEGRKLN
jgi:transcription-repair coupling factor (superfamily II helicase)